MIRLSEFLAKNTWSDIALLTGDGWLDAVTKVALLAGGCSGTSAALTLSTGGSCTGVAALRPERGAELPEANLLRLATPRSTVVLTAASRTLR